MNARGRVQWLITAAAVLGTAVAAASTSAGAATAAPAAARVTRGTLFGVAGTAAGDVWAVGSDGAGTLTEHWNGARWRVVPSPSPGTGPERVLTRLSAVAAVSRTDAWAVGSWTSGSSPDSATTRGLIEHWNGRRWTRVACPCGVSGDGNPELAGITAVSRSDIWAVGQDGNYHPLIEHWNGRRWARVPLGGSEDELTAVSATSARNAWAVGTHANPTHGVIAHWNGRQWTWAARPKAPRPSWLSTVVATSRSAAWAAGENAARRVSILRWNGRRWSPVPSPRVSGDLDTFNGLSAAPDGSLWAVGSSNGLDGTLTARWTGTRWVTVPGPGSRSFSALYGVYAASRHDAWAVGGGTGTVIVHWDGTRWRRVAS